MLKSFLKFSLLLGIFPVASAEYLINGNSVKNILRGTTPGIHTIHACSGCDDDAAIITMDNNSIEIRWDQVNCNYNDFGQRKLESKSGVLATSILKCPSFQDQGGLLGNSNTPVVTLYLKTAEFMQTSLNFKDSLKILPINSSAAFQGIELTKRNGTIYPLMDGQWDYTTPNSVIKSLSLKEGFLIVGCDIGFIFDTTRLKA
ncbi:hypothetical protein [Candidatus Odyssella thessalonicensis]|uniref:hypothetical protein n=1 Tax=Candidatus Odyssella thessalonicensis TaxID=84647 RepID=UPI000225C09E|nr:hypothetical protein [Candidatus Odyssella thessalonicensis]